jgi:hypothetical protein
MWLIFSVLELRSVNGVDRSDRSTPVTLSYSVEYRSSTVLMKNDLLGHSGHSAKYHGAGPVLTHLGLPDELTPLTNAFSKKLTNLGDVTSIV